MWDVEPNANLSATLGERGGRVLYSDPERGLTPLPGGEALFDGDPTTFYDPDLQEGVVRSSTLWVDLGATFRINRVRFHPRLDFGNRNRFLQEFTLSAAQFLDPLADSRGLMFFKAPNENTSPVVDKRFRSVEARVLALEPQVDRAWEIAELEVYSDGTLPVGEFESQPLRAGRPEPVWGRVLYEGGDVSTAPVVVRTRTGPDRSPLLYYLIQGGDVVQYSKAGWENAPPEDRGPVELNPAWSPWEPVTDGLVRSPPLNRYLQFHVTLTEPGAGLRELRFEYVYPPVARDLAAEISPLEARAGVETPFTLSLQVHLDRTGSESHRDTGFRQLQVRTAAEIGEGDAHPRRRPGGAALHRGRAGHRLHRQPAPPGGAGRQLPAGGVHGHGLPRAHAVRGAGPRPAHRGGGIEGGLPGRPSRRHRRRARRRSGRAPRGGRGGPVPDLQPEGRQPGDDPERRRRQRPARADLHPPQAHGTGAADPRHLRRRRPPPGPGLGGGPRRRHPHRRLGRSRRQRPPGPPRPLPLRAARPCRRRHRLRRRGVVELAY